MTEHKLNRYGYVWLAVAAVSWAFVAGLIGGWCTQ